MRLHDYLDYWARERPQAEFAVAGARSLTYAEAARAANRIASRLTPGSRVAVLAKNALWYPLLYFAAAKAGAVLVPLNWRLAPGEWRQILDDAEPELLIAGDEFAGHFECVREPELERWLRDGPATPPKADPSLTDPLYQMYTSGTTGTPKGAVLSHAAVTANILQVSLAHPVAPGERGLVVLPMFHAAIIPAAFSVLCRGGTIVILDAFDPEHVMRVLDEQRINVVTLVPAMLQACLAAGATGRFEHLRSIYYGASPIAEATLRDALERFGCGFVQSYGLTEAAQALTFLTDHRPELLLSAGRPALGTEVRIDDTGEILARGPQLMSGYWKRPEDTAAALRDGWLHTGDLGRIDEQGYLFVEDRLKDMVVSGGENVYPRVVEDVLFTHPAIAEAAVIGVPDERWGETVKAVVVLRPGATATEDELIAFCRGRLGGHERPRSVEFLESLPRTATGKVLKRVLREPYWAGQTRRVSGA